MNRFNPDEYETVDTRLGRFWQDHPEGRIRTWIENLTDTQIIAGAAVYRSITDEHPAATGFAHEVAGVGMVNKTSWVENGETSAVGRALANAGYAPKGQRPTREEMLKASRTGGVTPTPNPDQAEGAASPPPVREQSQLTPTERVAQHAATGTGYLDANGKPILWPFGKEKGETLERVGKGSLAWYATKFKPTPGYEQQHENMLALVKREQDRRALLA